jgi:prepilin-type N-terminal cleavage/methylation domain-containing protein
VKKEKGKGMVGFCPKRQGVTLVEVMLAIVIIAILAAGGLRYSFFSAGLIRDQKEARMVREAANGWMERMLAKSYADYLAVVTADDVTYYMQENSAGSFNIIQSDPGDTVSINGSSQPVRATAKLMDNLVPASGVSASQSIVLEVRILYGPNNLRSLCIKNIHTY